MLSRYAVSRAAGGRELPSHWCVLLEVTSAAAHGECVWVCGCQDVTATVLPDRRHAAFTAVPVSLFPFPDHRHHIVYTHTHTHTHTYLTPYRLYMNYRCYQITPQLNIFTQIGAVRTVDWILCLSFRASKVNIHKEAT